MTLSIHKPKRHFRPLGPVTIDRQNRLGRTVTHCLPMDGQTRDIVTGSQLTIGAGGSFVRDSKFGIVLQGSGSAAGASIPMNLAAYQSLSISFWLSWDAYANDDDVLFEFTSNFSSNNGFVINPNSGPPVSGLAQTSIGGTGVTFNYGSIVRPSAAVWHYWAVNFNRMNGFSNASRAFIDGAEVVHTFGLADITGNLNFSNDTLYIFSRNNASLFGAGKLMNVVIRGGYLMTPQDAREEYLNPWQIYKSVKPALYLGRT